MPKTTVTLNSQECEDLATAVEKLRNSLSDPRDCLDPEELTGEDIDEYQQSCLELVQLEKKIRRAHLRISKKLSEGAQP